MNNEIDNITDFDQDSLEGYFNSEENEVILDADEEQFTHEFEGICPKCFGSKYLMTERDGVIGVLYTSTNEDSEGKPIKHLIPCTICTADTTF